MKLKEWGYLRHKPRKSKGNREEVRDEGQDERSAEDADESDQSPAPSGGNDALMEEASDLLGPFDPIPQIRTMTTEVVMDMLDAVLKGDSQMLEQLIMANPYHVNYPIGMPFDTHNSRFWSHPAMEQCVTLQHPDQKLLDIACGLPSSPVIWVLVARGAKGSTHPLGTDLALHNAIKNGRTITVHCLLHSGRSNVHGAPESTWKPLLQAAFWNVPDIVRMLLDRGAHVNDTSPPLDGAPFKTALQLALDRRLKDYLNPTARERSERIVKMLLDAGADIHVAPAEDLNGLTPFETFLKPWESNPLWFANPSPIELECLEAFVRKGADLEAAFNAFPCSASSGASFQHQVLWHSTPLAARLLIDHALPTLGANGSNLLHEIVGYCPDAKRHPSDTLRDIEVLLKRGADPNSLGPHGSTPLTMCIERCPGVDVVARIKALLDGGADPGLQDGSSIHPVVLAARAFEEPLLSQVMALLIHKFRGNQPPSAHGSWTEGYFPIPIHPTFTEVLRYNCQNGGFEANMARLLPIDVIPSFRNAAFDVASKSFLDTVTSRVKATHEIQLSTSEKEEMRHIVRLRHAKGLSAYEFNQDFVMSFLMPTGSSSASTVPTVTESVEAILPSSQIYDATSLMTTNLPFNLSTSLGPNLPTPLPMNTPQAAPTSRRSSASSTSSNDSSASFFIPSTTQIRWPSADVGRATRPGDVEKARGAVLKYKCKDCNDGNKLTKAEYQKHKLDHYHTLMCEEVGCKRRFCVAERG